MNNQLLKLTNDNYYSQQADRDYFSVSQFKSFAKCESATLAQINGEIEQEQSQAMIVGSYTHAAFESDKVFECFKKEHEEIIYNRNGKPYADFITADRMIQTLKDDEFAMFALTGEKEQIYTADLFGYPWKCKVDNVNFQNGFFSDLKTTQSLQKREWSDKYNSYVSFVESYDYVLQMAIYRSIIAQATGRTLTPYIVAVTKETPSDKAVIHFDEDRFQFELDYTESLIHRFASVKSGSEEAERCERCSYCRSTKKLKGTIEVGKLLD